MLMYANALSYIAFLIRNQAKKNSNDKQQKRWTIKSCVQNCCFAHSHTHQKSSTLTNLYRVYFTAFERSGVCRRKKADAGLIWSICHLLWMSSETECQTLFCIGTFPLGSSRQANDDCIKICNLIHCTCYHHSHVHDKVHEHMSKWWSRSEQRNERSRKKNTHTRCSPTADDFRHNSAHCGSVFIQMIFLSFTRWADFQN